MDDSLHVFVPSNLNFQDYLAIIQTARTWADGYDLKSYSHLISTLAPQVVIDYTHVNAEWKQTTYDREVFAKLWLSDEHLGNPAMRTQHLLALPYFCYVGPRRGTGENHDVTVQDNTVQEIEVSWQTLASHGRYSKIEAIEQGSDAGVLAHQPSIVETSDHRAIVTHVYVRINGTGAEAAARSMWKLYLIKPQPIYMTGDFERIRRAAEDDS